MNLLFIRTALGVCALTIGLHAATTANSERVQLVRTPNGGIQPQAIVDDKGGLHLVYFKSEAKAGDLFYVRQQTDGAFSQPLQVNSSPTTAIAVGTIRGAHFAIGKNGRVHVAWNGNKAAPDSKHHGSPLWYTRLNDAGSAFEPQRDLIHGTAHLDGGGSIAADTKGNVYALWHAAPDENARGEEQRALFLARSTDDGQSFTREQPVNPRPTGACACCGVRAQVDADGNLYALYRTAASKLNRDETLIVSRDGGNSFNVITDHRWRIATCPMSSAAILPVPGATIAAWETADQVYFARIDSKTMQASSPVTAPGSGKRKHPSIAVSSNGSMLLAWTEGTGWKKGGSVAWQLFDASGSPTMEKGRAPGVPPWGLVAAAAKADGTFLIFY